MERTLTIPLDVVLRCTRIDNRWQSHVWRMESVATESTAGGRWLALREAGPDRWFLSGPASLELHRKETPGYRANLDSGAPQVFVILRGNFEAGGEEPLELHLVTASPSDTEAYGQNGGEIIGQAPMPGDLVELLVAFVEAHHVEEPFRKRQRQRHHEEEAHQFGQEPIAELRARQAARRRDQGDPS